jgi:hypothetical protein
LLLVLSDEGDLALVGADSGETRGAGREGHGAHKTCKPA